MSRLIWPTSVLCAALGFLTACAGSPAPAKKIYWLAAQEPAQRAEVLPTVKTRLPHYLRQQEMVLAVADNQLSLANYHFWAEPLQLGVESQLAERLALQAPQLKTLNLELKKLHGSADGAVVLDALWQAQLVCQQEISGRFYQTTQQAVSGYSSLVDSHRLLLDELAKSITAKIPQSCQ